MQSSAHSDDPPCWKQKASRRGLGWPEDRITLRWLENRGTIHAVEISVDIVKKE